MLELKAGSGYRIYDEGPRGISSFLTPEEEEIEDINEYGVDWEVNQEPELVAHLLENNPHERANGNDPFASASTPANLSEVLCEPPNCPFTLPSCSFSTRTSAHLSTYFRGT
ncbi:hypothetical protein B0H11DRAFT_2257093 [Mycena galericulata]|nr:hypothetical protein B0H11DRAFT_2257093 [Mycena galericulata]